MSLNHLVIEEELDLFAKSITTTTGDIDNLTVNNTLVIPSGTVFPDLEIADLTVTNSATIGSSDFKTTNEPTVAGHVLHTDNAGGTYWAPDVGTDGSIVYSGLGTSALNKISKFDSNDGLTCIESSISDDGATTTIENDARCKQLLTVGPDGDTYILPTARAVADDYIMESDSLGNASWVPNLRLQDGTGVITGGLLELNVDPTKFDVSAGTGQVIDPSTGLVTNVSWAKFLDQTFAYVGILTYVSIDINGLLVLSSTKPTPAETRDQIYLGALVHTDGVNINTTNDQQMVVSSTANQIKDFMDSLGFINVEGNKCSPSVLLTFQKAIGIMLSFGSNFKNEPKDPHRISLPAVDTNAGGTFQYRMQDGTSSALTLTDIDPTIYDDGSPYPGAVVPNNKFTIQHIFGFSSGDIKIQPGQNIYGSLQEAQAAIPFEPFIEEPSFANGILLAHLIVKKETTDLNNTVNARFYQAGKFGSITSAALVATDTIVSLSGENTVVAGNADIKATFNAVDRFEISAADTFMSSPDTLSSMSINDTFMLVQKAATNRILVDATDTILSSPAENYTSTLQDSVFRVSDPVGSRFDIGDTESFLISPDKTSGVNIQDTNITTSLAGVNRSVLDGVELYNYSANTLSYNRLGNTLISSFLSSIERMRIDPAESIFKSPSGDNHISVSNTTSTVTGPILVEGVSTFNNTAVVNDGQYIQVGSTSATNVKKGSVMTFIANSSFRSGLVVKIVDGGGGIAKVEPITIADPDSTGVIGISIDAATVDTDVRIQVSGIFEARVVDNAVAVPAGSGIVAIGDPLEKTDAGEAGRVQASTASTGTFAVALTAGVGNAAGTVTVFGVYTRNEKF